MRPCRPGSLALLVMMTALLAGASTRPHPAIAEPGDPPVLSATDPNTLLGRWTLEIDDGPNKYAPMSLDVVRCGSDFCGVKVSAKGECQQKIFGFKDNGPSKAGPDADDGYARYTGVLDWTDDVAKYYVTTSVYGANPGEERTKNPQARHLSIAGYPASQGIPKIYDSREIPFGINFVLAGPASCHVPSS